MIGLFVKNESSCAFVPYLSHGTVANLKIWLRGGDLNPRPLGYEPNELPDCSTPRQSAPHKRTIDVQRKHSI